MGVIETENVGIRRHKIMKIISVKFPSTPLRFKSVRSSKRKKNIKRSYCSLSLFPWGA